MTFYLHTYGCQMNVRDSEAVAARLEDAGHALARKETEADVILVNSCSVRGKAEDKAIGKLRELAAGKRDHPGRIVGVMGCMAQRLQMDLFTKVKGLDLAVGTRAAHHLPRLLRLVAKSGEPQAVFDNEDADLVPHDHRQGGLSAFVTVLLGCNRRCTYCIVPDVRGPEFSRPPREILDEIRALTAGGVREITLLGQSVLNYGRTQNVWEDEPPGPGGYREPFPRLLEAAAGIPGLERLRFTSNHPSGCTQELARAMRELAPVCDHLHLPLQSGSDAVLKRMRRGYGVASYLEAVERLRRTLPDCALTSDIIVGFPGETEADFEATRDLMRRVAFDNTYIFKYSPRPGTPASLFQDDVPQEVKAERNRILLEEQDRIGQQRNKAWIGREVEVLVEGPSARNPARWAGRNRQNKIVIFSPREGLQPGHCVRVAIESARPQTLYGRVMPSRRE